MTSKAKRYKSVIAMSKDLSSSKFHKKVKKVISKRVVKGWCYPIRVSFNTKAIKTCLGFTFSPMKPKGYVDVKPCTLTILDEKE